MTPKELEEYMAAIHKDAAMTLAHQEKVADMAFRHTDAHANVTMRNLFDRREVLDKIPF